MPPHRRTPPKNHKRNQNKMAIKSNQLLIHNTDEIEAWLNMAKQKDPMKVFDEVLRKHDQVFGELNSGTKKQKK